MGSGVSTVPWSPGLTFNVQGSNRFDSIAFCTIYLSNLDSVNKITRVSKREES
jgi:hypothetical protein